MKCKPKETQVLNLEGGGDEVWISLHPNQVWTSRNIDGDIPMIILCRDSTRIITTYEKYNKFFAEVTE